MNQFTWNPFSLGGKALSAPIVQGGMGVGISLSRLASAVANEGGVGVISAAGIGMLKKPGAPNYAKANADALRDEIRKARAMTRGVLGVNIMVALTDFAELVRTSIEEGIDVIFSGAGLPLDLPSYRKEGCRTALVPIVSGRRTARIIAKWWREKYSYTPDGFVLEGPKAGGHLGFKESELDQPQFQLEALLPDVLEEARRLEEAGGKPVPVIAGGGVFTGGDIHRILSLGASAVQMATRFVATEECDASDAFKEAYVQCRKEDIGIIKSPVGMPGRAITDAFLKAAANGEKHPKACPFHCISTCKGESAPYCISVALLHACRGRMEHGFAFVGENGWRIDRITTVKELFSTLREEFCAAAGVQQDFA